MRWSVARVAILFVGIGSSCERVPSHHSVPASTDGPPTQNAAKNELATAIGSATAPAAAPVDLNADDDDDGCGSQLSQDPPADLYLAITHGTESDKATAALSILRDRRSHARAVLRRAIAIVSLKPSCPHMRPLTDVLLDEKLDDVSRSAAAMALGTIANRFPCTFPTGACPSPHNPIPSWSQKALRDCAFGTTYPLMVRRSCVEAEGYVKTTSVTELVSVRDQESNDTMLRLFAGRAISRLTDKPSVTVQALDQLVKDAHKVAKQQ